jgi:hypothetical protein
MNRYERNAHVIVNNILATVRNACGPYLQGSSFYAVNNTLIERIRSIANRVLEQHVINDEIVAFSDIEVVPNGDIINVTYKVQPAYSLSNIHCQVSLYEGQEKPKEFSFEF